MATLKMRDVLTIIGKRADIATAMNEAVRRHGVSILGEIAQFTERRDADADEWAKLCVIKSLLSPGAKLGPNIEAAKRVYALLRTHESVDFDTIKAAITGISYGCASYGNNVRAIVASWQGLRALTAECMTWDGLTALKEAGVIFGQAEKARSWALALYDADSEVYTLDRHMIRAIALQIGVNIGPDPTIGRAAYEVLAAFMLDVHREVCGNLPPLVSQWAMWNEHRHCGHHASHAALAD